MSEGQQLLDAMAGVAYVIDRNHRIVACGGANWERFAHDNDAPDLADSRSVLGLPIEQFIAGPAQEFYRRSIDALLTGEHNKIELAFRCDSPSITRDMRLLMTPVRDDAGSGWSSVLVQSLTLTEDMRPPVDIYDHVRLLALLRSNSRLPMLVMCSFCLDVIFPEGATMPQGEWVTGETYYRRGGSSEVQISHGICPTCFARIDG